MWCWRVKREKSAASAESRSIRKPPMAGGAAHNNKCLSYFRKRYFFNSRLNTFEFQEGLFLLQLAGLSYHQTAKSSSTKDQLLLRTKIYTENSSIYYTSAQEKMKGFSRVTWDSVKSAGPSEKTAFVVFERFEFGGGLIINFIFYRYLKLPWLIRRKAGRKVSSAFLLSRSCENDESHETKFKIIIKKTYT